jgi:hypothetical protein
MACVKWFLLSSMLLSLCLGCGSTVSENLTERQRRFALIRREASEADVVRILGKPDEIRPVPSGGTLDGFRAGCCWNLDDFEITRWAYGVEQHGTFAKIGIVCWGKRKTVILAVSPVYDCSKEFVSGSAMLVQVQGNSHIPVAEERMSAVCQLATPACQFEQEELGNMIPFLHKGSASASGLACRVDCVNVVGSIDPYMMIIRATMTVMNNGNKTLTWRTDAKTFRSATTLYIYDANEVPIFRSYPRFGASVDDHEPAFVLQLPPGEQQQEQLQFTPGREFGRLSAGIYHLRLVIRHDHDDLALSRTSEFVVP